MQEFKAQLVSEIEDKVEERLNELIAKLFEEYVKNNFDESILQKFQKEHRHEIKLYKSKNNSNKNINDVAADVYDGIICEPTKNYTIAENNDVKNFNISNQEDGKSIKSFNPNKKYKVVNTLKDILKEKGIMQNWLAQTVGISGKSLSLIISNKSNPNINTVLKICSAINVRVEDVFKLEEVEEE